MSSDFVKDIADMHDKFGVIEAVEKLDDKGLQALLDFRVRFLKEEMNELEDAVETGNAEEVVDALIDLVVVSVGTLDLFDVDAVKAWDEVLRANLTKKVGIKESRPNPLGLPDLIKPEGWMPPSHTGNHGLLTRASSVRTS